MKIEQWIQDILKDIPENKWVNISCQIRKDGDSVYIDNITKKQNMKIHQAVTNEWLPWFAWYPVRLED